MEKRLEQYGARYHTLKTPRKLEWKHSLGSVDLEVSIGSQTLALSVSPAQAALLLHFAEQASWQLPELAALMGLSPSLARKVALFWLNQGACISVTSVYGYLFDLTAMYD